MLHQMTEQTRECCQPASNRRRLQLLRFPHVRLPRNHRSMVDASQLRRRRDLDKIHEVLHVTAIGQSRPSTLQLGQPDGFFGNGSQGIESGYCGSCVGLTRFGCQSAIIE